MKENKRLPFTACPQEVRDACPVIKLDKAREGDQCLCDKIPYMSCPKLLCEGYPCFWGTFMHLSEDGTEAIFPCKDMKCPGMKKLQEEAQITKKKFYKDMSEVKF